MDIEHPAIRETERTGYHDPAYLEWERQQEEKLEVCSLCEGEGFMTDEDYETGDCPKCEGTGFVTLEE